MPELNPTFLNLSVQSQKRPLIMGVLNITPDSFSDGGLYLDPERALGHARSMLEQGADILDLGGESTRPGATPVSADEELARILPVAKLLREQLPTVAWSIDTCKARVAEEALKLGACMINDTSALTGDPAMASLAVKTGCGVVLMHRKAPSNEASWSTADTSRYGDDGVVAYLRKWLSNRASSLQMEGLDKKQFWIDPGFGFGKSVEDNLALLKGLPELIATGYPVLLGTSRKSTLGAVLGGLPESQRLEATAATVALAAYMGVACLRVHDVKEMARVIKVVQAVKDAPGKDSKAPEIRPIHPFKAFEEF